MNAIRKPNPNVCKACGWHWFKHGTKGQCPGMNPDPTTGKKSRFQRAKP